MRDYIEKIYGDKTSIRNVMAALKRSRQVHYDKEKDRFDIQDDSMFIDLDTLCGDEPAEELPIQPAIPYESKCKLQDDTPEIANKEPSVPSSASCPAGTREMPLKVITEATDASDNLLYQKLVEERLKLMLRYVDIDIFSKKIRILSHKVKEDGFNIITDS